MFALGAGGLGAGCNDNNAKTTDGRPSPSERPKAQAPVPPPTVDEGTATEGTAIHMNAPVTGTITTHATPATPVAGTTATGAVLIIPPATTPINPADGTPTAIKNPDGTVSTPSAAAPIGSPAATSANAFTR